MKPIPTADGSHTFYIEKLDEHYHSIHGALQESMHVFIEAGLKHSEKSQLNIFEMGLGTGLNAYLTAIYAEKWNKKVEYFGIEAFPIEEKNTKLLNYNKQIGEDAQPNLFEKIHATSWDEKHKISSSFDLKKIHNKIQDFDIATLPPIDLVYYDAFAFSAQPELWDIPVLEKIYNMMSPGGILVTYCAKGIFKRNLKSLGFTIENLPGPPKKREMIRATKSEV